MFKAKKMFSETQQAPAEKDTPSTAKIAEKAAQRYTGGLPPVSHSQMLQELSSAEMQRLSNHFFFRAEFNPMIHAHTAVLLNKPDYSLVASYRFDTYKNVWVLTEKQKEI